MIDDVVPLPPPEQDRPMTTSELEHGTIALTDGTRIGFRPIRPEDWPALQRTHRRLSPRSIHARFFGSLPELSEAQARHFTHLDGFDRFALVGLHPDEPGEIIAVVRYDREPGTDRAEYAAVVNDQWQGRGLGLALTRHLIDAARRRGIRTLTAVVLPDNVRMLSLLRDLGLPERIYFGRDAERIEVDLA